jgi:hypothetical protein
VALSAAAGPSKAWALTAAADSTLPSGRIRTATITLPATLFRQWRIGRREQLGEDHGALGHIRALSGLGGRTLAQEQETWDGRQQSQRHDMTLHATDSRPIARVSKRWLSILFQDAMPKAKQLIKNTFSLSPVSQYYTRMKNRSNVSSLLRFAFCVATLLVTISALAPLDARFIPFFEQETSSVIIYREFPWHSLSKFAVFAQKSLS